MPESRDEAMTVAEVAAILKLNKQTVRNWVEPGIPGSTRYVDFGIMLIAAIVPVKCVAWRQFGFG